MLAVDHVTNQTSTKWNTKVINCLSNGHYPARSNNSKHFNLSVNESQRWTGITLFPEIRKPEGMYTAVYFL